jgi:hypothetical protein
MTTETQSSASSKSDTAIDLHWRIRGEYLEMPGLRLSIEQASRLWALERAACQGVLDALVGADFLRRDRDGRYLLRGRGY